MSLFYKVLTKNSHKEHVFVCFCKLAIKHPQKKYVGLAFRAVYIRVAAGGFLMKQEGKLAVFLGLLCKGKLNNIVSGEFKRLKAKPRLMVRESLCNLLVKSALR